MLLGCGRAEGDGNSSRSLPSSIAAPAIDVDAVETGKSAARDSAADVGESPTDDPVTRLERQLKRGQFEDFIDGALNAAADQPASPALQLFKAEALLAASRNEEAELAAQSAATLAQDDENATIASHALKLWATARFRQNKALDDPLVADLLERLPADDPVGQMLRFWCDALGQRTVYRVAGTSDAAPVELRPARAAVGTVPDQLNAIEARINGVAVPLAFVDTGTQQTLMTVKAAEATGVVLGPSSTRLVGFAGLDARPGVIETLELGSLVLHDVPVLVGNSPPLVALKGQMAMGTELMHHVRFTIDYPARRVFAARSEAPRIAPAQRPAWEIPVWTFSQACLSRGQLPDGTMARVLVDTGDRAGSFVSTRWARRNLPDFQRPPATVVFKFKQRNLKLAELALGSNSLIDWPIVDTIPKVLERLDTVDLLLGHDLLGSYVVTIDLEQRMLQLVSPPAAD
jgi:hypothetical protein